MLKPLITYLNSLIESTGYFDTIYPLAELIDKDSKRFPAVYYEDVNQYKSVMDFDKQNGSSYWRLVGRISNQNVTSAVNVKDDFQRTYPLALVCGIQRSKIGEQDTAYAHDKLSQAVQKAFKNNEINARKELGVLKVDFLFGDVIHEVNEIQAEEFVDISPKIQQKYLIVKILVNVAVRMKKCGMPDFYDDVNAPTSLTATTSGNDINLSWTDNSSNEDGFYIYRSSSYSGSYSLIGTNAAGDTTFTDLAPTKDVTWFYKVRAFDGTVLSAWSNVVTGYVSSGGASSYEYNVLIDGVDSGQDVTIDGTNVTINLI